MSIDQKSLLASETQRLESIAEMEANEGPEWAERYEPGTFGCHELLDRVHLVSSMFQQYVAEHPACLQNKGWHQLAATAIDVMEELYQKVGAAHLGREESIEDHALAAAILEGRQTGPVDRQEFMELFGKSP